MSRVFDRFMVDVKASSNAKVKRLKRAGKEVRWAWFHGVLPIAANAPMRGSFCVGSVAADEHDVAAVADVTLAEARKALQVARHLGMLDRDEEGVEWVHDFEVYNPEPKADTTAADRARRYRERQRARRNGKPVTDRDVTDASRRDDRDANGNVTPPEVEVGKREDVDSPGTTDAGDRVNGAGQGTGSLSDLADEVKGILERGIDGLTTDERYMPPTKRAILDALVEHEPSPVDAKAVAIDVRSIAQSQNRAPNIAALYAQKLAQQTAAARAAARAAA